MTLGLRTRLALSMGLAVVPLALATAWLQPRFRRDALAEGLAQAALARLGPQERQRCEANPRRWPGRRRHRLRPLRVTALDEALRPARRRAPRPGPAIHRALAEGRPWAAELREGPRGRPLLLVAVRTPWGEGPCAAVLLVRPAGPGLRPLGGPGLLAGLTVAGGAVLVVLLAAGPLVARLRRLTTWVRQAESEATRPPPPCPERGADEIGALAASFQRLLQALREQLEESRRRQRALRSYVRATHHDVAVPLSTLQAHLHTLERLLEEPAPPADEARAALSAAFREADYLGTLLRNLGTVARLQGTLERPVRTKVDLREVAARVVERLGPLARHRGVRLEHAVPPEPTVAEVDAVLVERAWSNLLHNAVRLARGRAALVLDRFGDGFELRIVDDGPGADPNSLQAHATRPLHEVDAARSRSEGAGIGLGLRIAWQVACVHGHALAFEQPDEGGLLVRWRGGTPKRERSSEG